MIQRKQTIYLLLSIIAMILTAVFPIAKFYGDFYYVLKIFSFSAFPETLETSLNFSFNLPMTALWIAIVALNVLTIFIYKKRTTQIKLVNVSLAFLIALIALIFFYYAPVIEKNFNVNVEYAKNIGIYMPIISFVCMLLANRGIKKDEELVKSLDRIR